MGNELVFVQWLLIAYRTLFKMLHIETEGSIHSVFALRYKHVKFLVPDKYWVEAHKHHKLNMSFLCYSCFSSSNEGVVTSKVHASIFII